MTTADMGALPGDMAALADFICARIDDERRPEAGKRLAALPPGVGGVEANAATQMEARAAIGAHEQRKTNVRIVASLPGPPSRRLLRIAARYCTHPDFRDEWRSL